MFRVSNVGPPRAWTPSFDGCLGFLWCRAAEAVVAGWTLAGAPLWPCIRISTLVTRYWLPVLPQFRVMLALGEVRAAGVAGDLLQPVGVRVVLAGGPDRQADHVHRATPAV